MNTGGKISIVFGLLVAIGITFVIKQKAKVAAVPAVTKASAESRSASSQPADSESASSQPAITATRTGSLPRIVDLGANKCIPCKKMAPILEELKAEYAGRMNVEFIDVWQNPDAGNEYGIRLIPTQIFFDAAGKERFRHQGFFAKEDILAKCRELGFDLEEHK